MNDRARALIEAINICEDLKKKLVFASTGWCILTSVIDKLCVGLWEQL